MRKIFLIPVLLLLASCVSSDPKNPAKSTFYVCDCNQMEQVKADIKQSILPANNKSDEEMEDVISKLQEMFIELNCPKKLLVASKDDWSIPLKVDSCKFYFRKY